MTHTQAMLCGLAAFFLWVVVDVAIKLGSMAELSPFLIMAVMGGMGMISLACYAAHQRQGALLWPRSLREQSVLGLCSIGINLANIVALKHLPLTVFYIIAFSAPLFIALVSAALKHEELRLLKSLCVIAGFIGVVIALGAGESGGDLIGYGAGFVGVLCFSALTIITHRITNADSAESIVFTSAIFVWTAGILGLLWLPWARPEGTTVLVIIVAGAINAFANILFNRALKNTLSTNVAQLHYTQLIFAAVFGYALWQEIPTASFFAGALLIVVSGLIVATKAREAERANSLAKEN